jgi:glyoxalase family protein
MDKVLGFHHITAIAGKAKRNFDFYTRILGLRMVKKTVNFDDPGTYHFYFADEHGSPGTILTFFPWENIQRGKIGTGMASEIGYSVPPGSLEEWAKHLKENKVVLHGTGKLFNEDYLKFEDPDGLRFALVVPSKPDNRKPWVTSTVSPKIATRGFHSITLTLNKKDATAAVLTELLDYKFTGQQGNVFRYETDSVESGSIVDIVEDASSPRAINAGGTVHHIAFRVKDEDVQMRLREKIVKKGYNITPKIDRNYFFSLYFREPGGVLFEIATDNPGFTADEPLESLGTNLKLPPQYESERARIESILPSLT